MASKVRFGRSALSLVLTFAMTAPSLARDCSVLLGGISSPKVSELIDGRLLQFGKSGWTEVPSGTIVGQPGQRIQFAYVVFEPADDRKGVILFKTGRQRSLDEAVLPRRVELSRNSRGVDNAPCGKLREFKERSISADGYDAYHDRGLRIPEQTELDDFHFSYSFRKVRCHQSNDANADSFYDWRSNRGQYSFDKGVVGYETFSQILALFSPSSAFANSQRLADQRVEAKQYNAPAGRPECVSFIMNVRGPGSFLRINDLEGSALSDVRFVRAAEKEWILAP